jgi:hypothetical protein
MLTILESEISACLGNALLLFYLKHGGAELASG